jgi:hypothetical protein
VSGQPTVPEDCVFESQIIVTAYIDPGGHSRYSLGVIGNPSHALAVGLLELAKRDILMMNERDQ